MALDRKSLVELHRQAARQRLDAAKDVRRSAAKVLEHVEAGPSLGSKFAACLDEYLSNSEDVSTREEIKGLVIGLLSDCKVTAENIKNRKSPQQMFNDYMEPMYVLLRTFISNNKIQGNAGQLSSFWNMVAAELESQLIEIFASAEISPQVLGDPASIVADELRREDL